MSFLTNPLTYLLLPVMVGTVYLGLTVPLASIINTIIGAKIGVLDRISWPTLISGAMWISLFTGGLLGTLYHVRRLFSRGRPVNDFSRLSTLSQQQEQIMRLWAASMSRRASSSTMRASTCTAWHSKPWTCLPP